MTDPTGPNPRRGAIAWTARAVQVRLRFLAAIALASLVVGRWDVLRTHWDRWTAPAARDPAMGAVSADTEYFCPMDPGVVSTWPGRCPVCQMATVRRSRGDMGPLPSGVVARVQFSPDRLLLGGIRAEAVGYRPLAAEVRSVGRVSVEGDRVSIRSEIDDAEAASIEAGVTAEVAPDPLDGGAALGGRVRAVERSSGPFGLIVEVAGPSAALRNSRFASVTIRRLVSDREPFRSMPRGEPPTRPGEPRSAYLCPDHPEVVSLTTGRCPKDDRPLDRSELNGNQRVGWWCPMHPKVVADRAGKACDDCGGMPLAARIVSYAPIGEVLAVPESAVIDTGLRKVVYIERMPGMFDGVEVRLGPRTGGYYPVVEGLDAGQAVASKGAFLIDAETRLNPGLAAAYFGARREAARPATDPRSTSIDGLSPEDRGLARSQATCPVTGKPLGSMGTPVRVVARGRAVFLCCSGCESRLRSSPEEYLAKRRAADPPAHHP